MKTTINKFNLNVMKNIFSQSNMRLFRASMIFLLVMSMKTATAQLSLVTSKSDLGQVIKKIEAQSQYQFFYEDQLLTTPVDALNLPNTTLENALNVILKSTNVSYKIEDNIVYLSNKQTVSANENQTQREITGVVVDGSGLPLIGVNVSIKGSSSGTITDFDGKYVLRVPNSEAQVIFSYIGYKQEIVSAKGKSVLNVTMKEDTQLIKEVVVTALGIKREKKMLGYSVQELKSDELNQTGDPSVTGALQGKVAGLQMNVAGTGLNGSTKITIRGNSSLADNNQPLWVVDGVPFSDSNNSSASEYGGVDRGGAAIDINPDDIESISVLKGPNAAALYGSRAGNGVILVTTKRGSKQEGLGVAYSGSYTWTSVAETIEMQDKYGQGTKGELSITAPSSWGSPLEGQEFTAWNGVKMPYKKYDDDKLKDYFHTGFSQTHNVSLGNTTEKSNYRTSVGFMKGNGIFSQEQLQKVNLDLKAGTELNKYISVDSKISLSRTKADNRPYQGKNGEMYQLLRIPNSVSLNDLKQYRTAQSEHVNWFGPSNTDLNPYYVNKQRDNYDDRWRAFGYYSLKLNFTPWLYMTGKYMFDYYRTQIQDTDRTDYKNFPNVDVTNDEMTLWERNFFEQNVEMMLFGNHTIGDKIQLSYSLGTNLMDTKSDGLMGRARNMMEKDEWVLNSAKGFNSSEQAFSRKRVYSAFGTLQFAWNNYLAVDLTARNDWSSALPSDNRSYFYPSVNVSYVISDFLNTVDVDVPTWLTFAKMRLSYAQVGKDTDPYQLYNRLQYHQTENGPLASTIDILENPNLKPEIASSYEVGLDMRFLNNRLGFDFTYYYSNTKNQIMKVPASAPYKWKRINAGNIDNKGVEMMIYSTPYKSKDFQFDLDLNLAHNKSVVNELAGGIDRMYFDNSQSLLVNVGAVKGGKLGDIFPLNGYVYDKNNQIIVSENGFPLKASSDKSKAIGNIQPDLLMSVSPSVSYKGFRLSALFDMKFGGEIVSVSEAIAAAAGTAKRTEDRRDILINGVTEKGEVNKKYVTAEDYYNTIGETTGFAEEFLYDASFIKLKELSLSYNFSRKLLKHTPFNSLRLSLVGRNLCYLLKHTPGNPEGGYDTNMYSQAIDYLSIPQTRTLGFSVNVGF